MRNAGCSGAVLAILVLTGAAQAATRQPGASRRDVEAILTRLADPSEKVASQARGELIAMGQDVVPVMLLHLDDPSPAVRLSVIEVLGRLGRLGSIADLVNLLENERLRVRESALLALLQIHPDGRAFGFVPEASPLERAPAVTLWREWAATRSPSEGGPGARPATPTIEPGPSPSAPPVTEVKTPEERLVEADRLLQEGKSGEALRAYESVASDGIADRASRRRAEEGVEAGWNARLDQADADLLAGRYEQARDVYRQAESDAPTREQRRRGARGAADAERQMQVAESATPAAEQIRAAGARVEAGQLDAALALLDEAKKLTPTEAELGVIEAQRRRIADLRAESRLQAMREPVAPAPADQPPAAATPPPPPTPALPPVAPAEPFTRRRTDPSVPLAILADTPANPGQAVDPTWLAARIRRAFQRIRLGYPPVVYHERAFLASLPSGACPVLEAHLIPEAWSTSRAAIVNALGGIGNPAAVPTLRRALQDPDAEVRHDAVQSLAILADPAAGEDLVLMLADPQSRVRAAAAAALGRLKVCYAGPLIVHLLADDFPTVRQAAARALGALGDASAIEPLIGRFQDSDPDVRRAVAEALDALGERKRDFYSRDLPPQRERGESRWRDDPEPAESAP